MYGKKLRLIFFYLLFITDGYTPISNSFCLAMLFHTSVKSIRLQTQWSSLLANIEKQSLDRGLFYLLRLNKELF